MGGARIPAPGQDAWAAKNDIQRKNLELASRYYEEARHFARLCSQYSATTYHREFVIVTGGGPGVMEAGNRGADDVGAPSIGLNIVLPHEQAPNPYVTPDLCFNFHYFAIRKMHFLIRAKALTIFPGGFGTLDELFETLTLIQTGRMERVPVILFGKEFWQKSINVEFLAEQGTISPDDLDLLTYVDTAQEGWEKIRNFYDLKKPSLNNDKNLHSNHNIEKGFAIKRAKPLFSNLCLQGKILSIGCGFYATLNGSHKQTETHNGYSAPTY